MVFVKVKHRRYFRQVSVAFACVVVIAVATITRGQIFTVLGALVAAGILILIADGFASIRARSLELEIHPDKLTQHRVFGDLSIRINQIDEKNYSNWGGPGISTIFVGYRQIQIPKAEWIENLEEVRAFLSLHSLSNHLAFSEISNSEKCHKTSNK